MVSSSWSKNLENNGAHGNLKNLGNMTTAESVAQSTGQTPKAAEYHRPKTSKQNNHSNLSNIKGQNKTPSITIQISQDKSKKSKDRLNKTSVVSKQPNRNLDLVSRTFDLGGNICTGNNFTFSPKANDKNEAILKCGSCGAGPLLLMSTD